MAQTCNSSELGKAYGQTFHESLYFTQASEGYGKAVLTQTDLTSGARLVSCLYSNAITPEMCRDALRPFIQDPSSLSDRQATASVLALHLVSAQVPDFQPFCQAYVDSLPSTIFSPLSFNAAELALLQNTNLHGASLDRLREWEHDHNSLCRAIETSSPTAAQQLTWTLYLWGCTIISSRAFPSSLIDGNEADSKPILFPAVDTLNHNPKSKILWLKEKDRLTLITEERIRSGTECYNNYGPKSNEELLLGYGFVLEDNEADIVALRLGTPRAASTSSSSPSRSLNPLDAQTLFTRLAIDQPRHLIPRSGELPSELLAQMRFHLADQEELLLVQDRMKSSTDGKLVLGFLSWMNELNMLDQLESMLQLKLNALGNESATKMALVNQEHQDESAKRRILNDGMVALGDSGQARKRVVWMIEVYRRGQRDILRAAQQHLSRLMDAALAGAQDAGMDIDMD